MADALPDALPNPATCADDCIFPHHASSDLRVLAGRAEEELDHTPPNPVGEDAILARLRLVTKLQQIREVLYNRGLDQKQAEERGMQRPIKLDFSTIELQHNFGQTPRAGQQYTPDQLEIARELRRRVLTDFKQREDRIALMTDAELEQAIGQLERHEHDLESDMDILNGFFSPETGTEDNEGRYFRSFPNTTSARLYNERANRRLVRGQ